MGMAAVLSHITFVVANPSFQTGCQARPSRYLQSFLLILDAPQVLSLPKLRPNASEREAPVAVFETDNSKASKHLSAAKVGSGKEPAFSE